MSDAAYRRTRHLLLKRNERQTGMICKWIGGHIWGFDRDLEEWVKVQ
jgi:hypothetical protein